ncbi:MAG: hypothetical protein ABMA26_06345 [Limisphaerales bacterium]
MKIQNGKSKQSSQNPAPKPTSGAKRLMKVGQTVELIRGADGRYNDNDCLRAYYK